VPLPERRAVPEGRPASSDGAYQNIDVEGGRQCPRRNAHQLKQQRHAEAGVRGDQ